MASIDSKAKPYSRRCLCDQLLDGTIVLVLFLRVAFVCVTCCITKNGVAHYKIFGGQRPSFGVVAQRRCSIAWYENVPDCLAFACCGIVVDTFPTCVKDECVAWQLDACIVYLCIFALRALSILYPCNTLSWPPN